MALVLAAAVGTRSSRVVNSSDSWWQACIILLMHACDAIVVDVSDVSTGTEWELAAAGIEGVRGRMLFVCFEPQLETARAALDRAGFPGAVVHRFDARGALADAAAFYDDMRRAMVLRLGEQASSNTHSGLSPIHNLTHSPDSPQRG